MRTVLLFVSIVLTSTAAFAAPVALRLDGAQVYQALESSPCIFGDPSCRNPEDFGFTLLPANAEAGSAVSPAYSIGEIRRVAGDLFAIAIDLRQAKDTYRLELFTLSVDGAVQYSFSGNVPLFDHRAGVTEQLLSGFDIRRFSGNSQAVFHLTFSGANGGRDRFFISAVPEPASAALLAAVLLSAPFIRRRLNRN